MADAHAAVDQAHVYLAATGNWSSMPAEIVYAWALRLRSTPRPESYG